jgi:hypothetical protein
MTRKALLLILFYSLLQPVQSAVIREQFAQTVDYIGWQIMDAYMQDYLSIRPDQTAERAGYEAFRQQFGPGQYSIEQPPGSEALATFLENNDWRNASINLYRRIIDIKSMYRNEWTEDEAIDFLQQQIQNVSLQPLGVASEEQYERLAQTKALLRQEIKQYLATEATTPAETATEPENAVQEIVDDNEPEPASGYTEILPEGNTDGIGSLAFLDSQTFQLVLLGLILLLLGLLWYAFSLLKKQDARIDRYGKRIEELTVRSFQKSTPYVTREEVAQVKNRLKEAEAKVASLQQRLVKEEKSKTASTSKFGPNRPPAPVTKSYYLSTPNSDGTFPAGSMSAQFRPSASIYHFEVLEQNGENTAEFTVANNADAMKDALSSPGSYLEPVCDSANSYFPGAQRIINVKPGKAIRRGDQWVVLPEDKALIRYE